MNLNQWLKDNRGIVILGFYVILSLHLVFFFWSIQSTVSDFPSEYVESQELEKEAKKNIFLASELEQYPSNTPTGYLIISSIYSIALDVLNITLITILAVVVWLVARMREYGRVE